MDELRDDVSDKAALSRERTIFGVSISDVFLDGNNQVYWVLL